MTSRSRALLVALAAIAGCALPVDGARAQSIRLRAMHFDPLEAAPELPGVLAADPESGLWVVQFRGPSRDTWRAAVRGVGGHVASFLPDQAHVVRIAPRDVEKVRSLPFVRWVGGYAPAFRMEPGLAAAMVGGAVPAQADYDVVLVDKHRDKPGLFQAVAALGGIVAEPPHGGLVVRLLLSARQFAAIARRDEVLWIERGYGTEVDAKPRRRARSSALPMDNARVQTGADHLEAMAGMTGQGLVAHTYEGLQTSHPDFTNLPQDICSAGPTDHGHAVAGILLGNGTSISLARGMLPDAQGLYTAHNFCFDSRYVVYGEVVDAGGVLSTASWGTIFTSTTYNAQSAALDDAIFDHDLAITQSQSNTGSQLSRPEAWAKNVISCGAVDHGDDADPSNDSWAAGNASIGPASDGRIKPDLVGYDDEIMTSDRTGADGYTIADFFPSFGGTSGATPMVGGSVGLAIQMFTDGLFGNPLRVPGGTRFENRPHAVTAKSLVINSARQYAFGPSSTDNRREHQGWGFPDLARLYDLRSLTLLVDEEDSLTQGESTTYQIQVADAAPELKVTMSYLDPPGNPGAAFARVNDVDLTVTAPDGTVYHGNAGLMSGTASIAGGAPDDRDTVECVFVPSPLAGVWSIEVHARAINMDARIETPNVDDVDYALVAQGGLPLCAGVDSRSGVGCADRFGVDAQIMTAGAWCGGETVTTEVAAFAPTAMRSLMVGDDASMTLTGMPLPADLTPLGMAGCWLYQNNVVTVPLVGDTATGSVAMAIPNTPGITGLTFYLQGAFLDPQANALGVGTTDLLTASIR